MEQNDGREGEYFEKSPIARRLPTVGSLALALVLAAAFGHSVWTGLLIFAGTLVVCVLLLHFVFRQPLERLLQYREFDDP